MNFNGKKSIIYICNFTNRYKNGIYKKERKHMTCFLSIPEFKTTSPSFPCYLALSRVKYGSTNPW